MRVIERKNTTYYIEDIEMSLMIPDNLQEILDLPFGKKTIEKSKRAKKLVKYFLSLIYTKCRLNEKIFVPISSSAIIANVNLSTHVFTELVTVLLTNGFIVIGNNYKVGNNSREYGLGPRLKDSKWIRDPETDIYQKCYINRKPEPIKLNVNNTLFSASSGYIKEKREWSDETADFFSFFLLDNWSNDKTTGITNREFGYWSFMPKEARGTYEIDSEPVIEVDIVSSNALMMYAVIYKDLPDDCHEKAKMKALLEAGKFYDKLVSDRSYVKEIVNSFVCGKRPTVVKDNNKDNVAITEFFKKEFPFCWSQINNAKGFVCTNKEGKEKYVQAYKSLGYQLQNLESSIVVESLCNEFEDIYSLHDGVIVRKSMGDQVKNRLEQIIAEKTGLKVEPKIVDRRKVLEEL